MSINLSTLSDSELTILSERVREERSHRRSQLRFDFKTGDKVHFWNKRNTDQIFGTVIKIMPKNIKVAVDNEFGGITKWTVSPSLLAHTGS